MRLLITVMLNDSDKRAKLNLQPKFLTGLSDSRLFHRFSRFYTAAGKRIVRLTSTNSLNQSKFLVFNNDDCAALHCFCTRCRLSQR